MTQAIELHACDVGDIPESGARKFCPAGRQPIALFKIGGSVFATADTCTHAEGSLSEGYVEGDIIVCPVHPGEFHIPTGRPAPFRRKRTCVPFRSVSTMAGSMSKWSKCDEQL